MVDTEYANAYSEVLEILKYISVEDYKKIPESKINVFKENQNKNHIFRYNPQKTLDEQAVSKRAKAIIGLLFRDYWATERQKEKIVAKQKYDRYLLEEKKKAFYNVEDIFKKKNCEVKEEAKEMVIYKESIFKKLINKIKSILGK